MTPPPPGAVHRDPEIRWFYVVVFIVVGITLAAGIYSVLVGQSPWWVLLIIGSAGLAFAVLGWPLSARVGEDGSIEFANLLRRVRFRPGGLARIKVIKDAFGGHLRLIPASPLGWVRGVSYRTADFEDARTLAQAVQSLAAASPQCRWGPGAEELLDGLARSRRR